MYEKDKEKEGRRRRDALGIDQSDEFVTLDLGIRAHIAMFDEPGAHFRFGPSVPDGVGGGKVVVLNHLGHLFALDLSIRLDNVVRDEPRVEVAIRPRRPDVVLLQCQNRFEYTLVVNVPLNRSSSFP